MKSIFLILFFQFLFYCSYGQDKYTGTIAGENNSFYIQNEIENIVDLQLYGDLPHYKDQFATWMDLKGIRSEEDIESILGKSTDVAFADVKIGTTHVYAYRRTSKVVPRQLRYVTTGIIEYDQSGNVIFISSPRSKPFKITGALKYKRKKAEIELRMTVDEIQNIYGKPQGFEYNYLNRETTFYYSAASITGDRLSIKFVFGKDDTLVRYQSI